MTPTELRFELNQDPAGLGYAGKTDAQVAAAMSAKTRPAPIEAGEVRRLLMVIGAWSRIAAIARGLIAATDEAQAVAAVALVEALAEIPSFDLTNASYAAAVARDLDAAVSASLISAEAKAAILALGQNRRSRCAELGWPDLAEADITRARAL